MGALTIALAQTMKSKLGFATYQGQQASWHVLATATGVSVVKSVKEYRYVKR
jgi:ABC-type thiamin/hydroxymethylpyrimidine transport system permease subunit